MKRKAMLALSLLVAACTGIDTLEVSATDTRAHPDDQPFIPLRDGDRLHIFFGGQGASMSGLRLRVTGSHAPSSIAQEVKVFASTGVQEAMSSSTTPCLPEPDGSRVTATKWIPGLYLGDNYDPSTVEVSAEGRKLSVMVHPVPLDSCSQLFKCAQGCCFGGACVSDCLGAASPTAQTLFAPLSSCEAQACAEYPDGGLCAGDAGTDGGALPTCVQTVIDQSCAPGGDPACGRCAAYWLACNADF